MWLVDDGARSVKTTAPAGDSQWHVATPQPVPDQQLLPAASYLRQTKIWKEI